MFFSVIFKCSLVFFYVEKLILVAVIVKLEEYITHKTSLAAIVSAHRESTFGREQHRGPPVSRPA